MGFNKFIKYGDNFELYEYEKNIIRLGRSKPRRKKADGDKDLGAGGENTLSERQLGKRQDNARRASLGFRRLVGANLGSDSRQSARPILVTLTYGDNFTDLKRAYRHFSSFIQSLRYKYKKIFKYVCVPEFQKRGAVHFHALIWGLPTKVLLSERQTRALARTWEHGFVYLKPTDGNEKLSFYLSKYMAKAFIDPRLKNQKCYVASKNIQRPIVQSGFSPVWPVLEDHGIDENSAEIDRTYPTEWLGKGRFRLFKTSKQNKKE